MRIPPLLSKIVIPLSFGSVSGIAFVVSKLMRAFSSLSTVFIVVACFGVIIGVLLKGRRRYAMFALSVILGVFIFLEQRSLLLSTTRTELVSDATESLVDYYYDYMDEKDDSVYQWINKENFVNDKIRCFLVPFEKYSAFCDYAFDGSAVIRDDPVNRVIGVCALNLRQEGKEERTKYKFTLAYAPHLFKGRHFKGAIALPESTYQVLRGLIAIDDKHFQQGKDLLEQALSQNNPAASYYLSKWYHTGYGDEPDKWRADSLLMVAVESGSRKARFEWGSEILKDPRIGITDLKKIHAEDYLREATVLRRSIATVTTANLARNSFLMLNDYYRSCGKERNSMDYYRKAYKMAKRNTGAFTDNEIRYVALLDNCISLGKYDEALEIIKEGRRKRQPHCYLVLADMYSEGKGLAKNVHYAETLLRIAADSLDYYPAYRGLALLYESRKKDGADFWNRLYEIEFSNKTE